ncbi:hypothetical protein QE152_g15220 [Popillia japonica]|uniref:Uncharacterized protein n=1 Tax=Popillia japonica TaxID=7064 RepID=A0AAW1L938_POPJA
MNRHVQSQLYFPDSYYNRRQNDVHPSYPWLQSSVAVTSAQILIPATAHTLQSEVATASESNTSGSKTSSASGGRDRNDVHPSYPWLQLSVAVTSALMLIPATAHTLQSEVATASESNTSGSKTSSGGRDRNDNPRIRQELVQFLQLYHSGSAEQ